MDSCTSLEFAAGSGGVDCSQPQKANRATRESYFSGSILALE